MVKLGIGLFIVFIIYNLAMAGYYMLTDRGSSTKAVKALSWRIGLSILLILLIMLGIYTGHIKPHGVLEGQLDRQAPASNN
jgi:hypothetical protein